MKTETKHTPGLKTPVAYRKHTARSCVWVIHDADRGHVAETVTERDAIDLVDTCNNYERVRAESDELAAALKRINDGDVLHGKSLFTHADVVEAYQAIARAALAKLGDK